MFGFDSFEEIKQLTPAQRYMDPSERMIFSETLLAKGSISVEHHLKKKDGTPIWGSITARVVHGENGEALYFDCTMEDITARKLAEQALQRSESKYRAIVEDQIELVARFLPDGTLTFVNRAYYKYFGENPSDLLGHTFWHHVPLDDQDKFKQYLQQFSVHQPVSTIEHRVFDQKGNVRWQQWTDKAFFDERGDIVEFQAVGRYITELKWTEEVLRESEEQFKTMFEMASIGIAQANPNTGQFLRVNQKMLDITRYSFLEMLTMRIGDITHPEDRERDLEAFQGVVSGKSKDYRLEKRYVRKDGSIVWVNVNMTVVRDPSGQPHPPAPGLCPKTNYQPQGP